MPRRHPTDSYHKARDCIVLAYRHVEEYDVRDGKPACEPNTIRQALRFLRRLYGTTPAKDFSPKCLKAVRQAMIDHVITRKVKVKDKATGEVEEVKKVLARADAAVHQQAGRMHQAPLRVGRRGGTRPRRRPRRAAPRREP